MSRGHRLSPHYNSDLNRNLWEEIPERDHNLYNNLHTSYDMGFQQNNNSENIAIYPNSVDSRLGYNPNTRYFEEPRSNPNDNHIYYRSGMPSHRSREDRSPLPKRMRPNTYEYSEYPTHDSFVNFQSNMLRTNYRKQDEQYFPEFERNSNVSNGYHNAEREIFNNVTSEYHHNDLRENRNRSRETRPSNSFSRRDKTYMSNRSPPSSNHREVHSRIKRNNSRERQLERPRERSRRRSRLESNSRNILSHKESNLSSTPSEYRKSLKLKPLQNAISRRTAVHNSYKSENDKKNVIKTIKKMKSETIKTEKESNDNRKNETVVSGNKKSVKRNGTSNALVCPHCNLKYLTSISYTLHLKSARHLKVFRQVVLKRNSVLAKLRVDQRSAQKIIEAEADDLNPSASYCSLCRLNHQQAEATHEASKYHNKIKDFVMRDCKICKLKLKSHVAYESHICSLAHLRKKACLDVNKTDGKRCSSEKTNVIDEEDRKADDAIADKPRKELIIVGREQVYKVEAYYCKMCNVYLPQVDKNKLEAVISAHCSKQLHLKHYYRYRRSNKRKLDEALGQKEDITEEQSTIKEDKCIDVSTENSKCLLLFTEERLLLREEPSEKDEKNFDDIENTESASIDVIGNPKIKNESKILENICLDADKQLANKEQPVKQEKTPKKDDKVEEYSEELENSENKIIDEVNKANIQEEVNQDESQIQNINYCIDDKQWVNTINQDLTDILEEAAEIKTEYRQSEGEQYDKFSNTEEDIEEVKDN